MFSRRLLRGLFGVLQVRWFASSVLLAIDVALVKHAPFMLLLVFNPSRVMFGYTTAFLLTFAPSMLPRAALLLFFSQAQIWAVLEAVCRFRWDFQSLQAPDGQATAAHMQNLRGALEEFFLFR